MQLDALGTGQRVPVAPSIGARALRTPELGLAGITVGAIVILGWMNPAFLTGSAARSILVAAAAIGIIAVGQAYLLVAGEFDLSVGSVAALSAIVAAQLMTSSLPLVLALAAGVGVGAGVGLVNGVLTVKVGLPAFIVTLGMLFVARGAALVIPRGGQPIYPLPDAVTEIGKGSLLGLPLVVWVLLALVVLADLVLRFSAYGRRLYATGGNVNTAALAGINTDRVKMSAFVVVGTLSSVAGLLVMSRLGRGQPTIGVGWELQVIAAVVVGGLSLFGGIGTIFGAFLGVLFLQIVTTGLVFMGVDASLQPVAIGVVMIVAVSLDHWRLRRLRMV